MGDDVRRRVRITGVVQGVGFRPFVWRRATRLGLSGWVENDPGGVTVEVEGAEDAITGFLTGLAAAAPPLARVEGITQRIVSRAPEPTAGFAILESQAGPWPRAAVVPPDTAPCRACLGELSDPANRRFGHPFISCTDCGPRFTIIDALPYDRLATTMRVFAMCQACADEYHDPSSRRFHCQPIACPACGPAAWFSRAAEASAAVCRDAAQCVGADAIEAARGLIRAGEIVAIKGVGGFHLACDATNRAAVQVLRDRKRRRRKPFAVMVADVGAARSIAVVDDQERRLLEGGARPIVLLRRTSDFAGALADSVAPGNGFLGVMLPSSPLHHLLSAGLPPLVMTSGNLADEPIAIANDEAAVRLGGLADGFLLHDRDIRVACDDSVVRCVAGLPLPIRRSRGHAPLPIGLVADGPTVLAVGGDLKATVCVAGGREAVTSQHVGDMGILETVESLGRTAHHLLTLFGCAPAAIIADLHPGLSSTAWARDVAVGRGVPLVQVQHHEAHVASLLAEQGFDIDAAEGLIGICFDGTGLGRDGAIHGGEVFVVRGGGLVRTAHLLPFPLPGGDAAVRQPWRTALAVLHAAGIAWDPALPCVAAAPPTARMILERQLAGGFGCQTTTSMGRLFDAVASIAGVRHEIDYEAEAALNLESLAAAAVGSRPYAGHVDAAADGMFVLDWRPLVAAIVDDTQAGRPAESVALGFHEAVVRMVVDACLLLRDRGGTGRVGLTGGVFQNAVLVERLAASLHRAGFEVLTHHVVPPNDGGLALGQAVLGRHQIRSMMP